MTDSTLNLKNSLKGKFDNYLSNNNKLQFIIDFALNRRLTDIYLTSGRAVQYKKNGIITLTENDLPEDSEINPLITEDDFSKFLSVILPSEKDIASLNSILNDRKSFDYGIGYKFKHNIIDDNMKQKEIISDIRLRLNFVNTLDGVMLTIRPLLNIGLSFENLTSMKWAINYGSTLMKANKDKEKDNEVNIETKNRSIDMLKKMEKVNDIIKSDFERTSGLIIVTGSTGEGKSTLVTSLLEDLINKTDKHILTLEDPIEHIFTPKRGKVTQIEVGTHIDSFSAGIKGSKRENPDIVYIQEIRDKKSAEALLELLGSGVLVITTLHTGSVSETIDRLVGLMADNTNQSYIRNYLSRQIISIINQKLIYVKHNDKIITKGIQEYLHVVGPARTHIKKNEYNQLESLLLDSQPPNKSITKILWNFYILGIISMNDLIMNVTNQDSLEALIADDKSEIRSKDKEKLFNYFGVDKLEDLKGV